jgi:hypothetical protein
MYPYFRFSEGTFQDILDSLDFALWFNKRSKAYRVFKDDKVAKERLCYLIKSFLESISEDSLPAESNFEAGHIYQQIL